MSKKYPPKNSKPQADVWVPLKSVEHEAVEAMLGARKPAERFDRTPVVAGTTHDPLAISVKADLAGESRSITLLSEILDCLNLIDSLEHDLSVISSIRTKLADKPRRPLELSHMRSEGESLRRASVAEDKKRGRKLLEQLDGIVSALASDTQTMGNIRHACERLQPKMARARLLASEQELDQRVDISPLYQFDSDPIQHMSSARAALQRLLDVAVLNDSEPATHDWISRSDAAMITGMSNTNITRGVKRGKIIAESASRGSRVSRKSANDYALETRKQEHAKAKGEDIAAVNAEEAEEKLSQGNYLCQNRRCSNRQKEHDRCAKCGGDNLRFAPLRR